MHRALNTLSTTVLPWLSQGLSEAIKAPAPKTPDNSALSVNALANDRRIDFRGVGGTLLDVDAGLPIFGVAASLWKAWDVPPGSFPGQNEPLWIVILSALNDEGITPAIFSPGSQLPALWNRPKLGKLCPNATYDKLHILLPDAFSEAAVFLNKKFSGVPMRFSAVGRGSLSVEPGELLVLFLLLWVSDEYWDAAMDVVSAACRQLPAAAENSPIVLRAVGVTCGDSENSKMANAAMDQRLKRLVSRLTSTYLYQLSTALERPVESNVFLLRATPAVTALLRLLVSRATGASSSDTDDLGVFDADVDDRADAAARWFRLHERMTQPDVQMCDISDSQAATARQVALSLFLTEGSTPSPVRGFGKPKRAPAPKVVLPEAVRRALAKFDLGLEERRKQQASNERLCVDMTQRARAEAARQEAEMFQNGGVKRQFSIFPGIDVSVTMRAAVRDEAQMKSAAGTDAAELAAAEAQAAAEAARVSAAAAEAATEPEPARLSAPPGRRK